jgi:hypothetical protein
MTVDTQQKMSFETKTTGAFDVDCKDVTDSRPLSEPGLQLPM